MQLEREYQNDPVWRQKEGKQLAERLKLPVVKVYKWFWVRRQKDLRNQGEV